MDKVTFGSLFAGIGGLDLGFERCGFECRWQVEIEPYAIKVLEKHWPNVHRERDINECSKENLKKVDIIAGGFPCQDISYAGRGAGLDGERSGLFFQAVRLVCELRPRVVVLENVAGLLTRGLDRVLGTLAEVGYDAEWHCIPAAAVGAPHIRDRVFVIAYSEGDGRNKINEDRGGCEKRTGEGKEQGSRDGGGTAPYVPHATVTGTRDKARKAGRQRREPADALKPEVLRQGNGEASTDGTKPSCGDVPDPNSVNAQGVEPSIANEEERQGQNKRQTGSQHASKGGFGETKPSMGRGTDGLSDWLDLSGGLNYWEDGEWDTVPRVGESISNRGARLKGLGNAIVPQVAEAVGRIVIERLKGENIG